MLSAIAATQAFVMDSSQLPFGFDATENVDFCDVDLDGDWDIGLANGGDLGVENSGLWINQGGQQGGALGLFVDESEARLPPLLFSSTDIEFADLEGDGDGDIFLTNTSMAFSQGCRFWINTGGAQEAELGYFVDETGSRWIGVGQLGSSIPPEFVLADGSFKGHVHDCDFGDLDNDGDLDLVYGAYFLPGDFAESNVPTRLFLNDGYGRFKEFNPSGFTPLQGWLEPGDPGLWCEGTYAQYTTDASGQKCDPTARSLSVELGDVDSDFDLDLFMADQQQKARFFVNRLDGSALAPAAGSGALAFRDMSAQVLPVGFSTGGHSLEVELADLDGDGDWDLVGTGTGPPGASDTLCAGDGLGWFAAPVYVGGADIDSDWDADALDYDGDGDLDLFFADSVNQDRLHRNDGALVFTEVPLPWFPWSTLDGEVADTDGDGDYDVLVADHSFAKPFFKNVTQVPDHHPPRIPKTEPIGDRVAGHGSFPVRAHVLDNAPYYVTWYDEVGLEFSVDGVELPFLLARCSLGQVFRAVLPANLFGQVAWRFVATDEHGNAGSSLWQAYSATYGPAFQLPYGLATAGLAGGAPVLRAVSVPFSASTFHLALSSAAPEGTPTWIAIATQPLVPGVSVPGLLQLQIQGTLILVAAGSLNAGGNHVLSLQLGQITPGISVFVQGLVFDPTPGGHLLASSKGLQIITQ